MWKTTSFRLFSYCLFDILYRQLEVLSQTVNPFRAADGVVYCTDWWVQGGTLLATPAQRLQKNRPLRCVGWRSCCCLYVLNVRPDRQNCFTPAALEKALEEMQRIATYRPSTPSLSWFFFSPYKRMTGCCMMLGHDHFLRHNLHFFLRQPYLI